MKLEQAAILVALAVFLGFSLGRSTASRPKTVAVERKPETQLETPEIGTPNRANFRIMSNGKDCWFVQERSFLGGWNDDIWGGYKPTYEAASNRVNELIEFRKKMADDKAFKAKFKPVE